MSEAHPASEAIGLVGIGLSAGDGELDNAAVIREIRRRGGKAHD